MKERLQILMSRYGYTAARLADEIGVQRSGISHILSGRNQPSYDFILKIANTFPEINTEWLLTGRGDIQKALKAEPRPELKQDSVDPHTLVQPRLFPDPEDPASSGKDTPGRDAKVTSVNNIDRIVVFYKDGTFSHYIPAGQD
jgi:transcriptional regulator with XRE-family HTH domain